MNDVGNVTGDLILVIGDAEIKIGKVTIPLEVTRVCKPGDSRMTLGLGVDLESVRDTVAEIFRQNRNEEER
jgi:hypothetical protein